MDFESFFSTYSQRKHSVTVWMTGHGSTKAIWPMGTVLLGETAEEARVRRIGASTSSMTARVMTIRGSIRVVGCRGSGPVLVIGGKNGFVRFGTKGYPTAPRARREWIGSQSCGSREWITSQSCGRCWALDASYSTRESCVSSPLSSRCET
jgi:hypothetical protein